ncbi:response regulator [Mucilaginibacter xinganensis]|uniref:cAMP-binding domain of CRP or a regulatory subunit of cAMP-dependent protein kinases n=1 Tax=Mucilaginibacter xinganensis TaxID=1234841 RepID=A0A223NYT5_9SPHI|nr:response regulator [Mucilaginibacter xinganensis]ASU34731.1 cAMP-binding domain of CRP or a regulatory subunit of cAMP-dependent protein kinases [Mucilaginibacter xinganensis]
MNKRILLIDDDNNIRALTSKILEQSGYDVMQSENGMAGVSVAIQNKPDLILCDVKMPDLDGFAVLNMLKENQETAYIPFIFITANTERLDYRKGMELGADDYIHKPFTQTELVNALKARLSKNENQKTYLHNTLKNPTGNMNDGRDQLKLLIEGRKIRKIEKKQILYYEGDQPMGIYLIIEGSVKTIKQSDDGRTFMTGLYKTHDYLGVNAILLDDCFNETAIAIEDTTVCMVPKNLISNLLVRYPDISQQFLKMLSNNLREKEDQMLELAYHSVRKRLAKVILRLSRYSDDPLVLKISREEIANMAGMAIETVSRTLSDFKDEGLINKKPGQIEIFEFNKLVTMKN